MKRIFGFVIATLVTFAIAAFFSKYEVDPHHDGIFLKPAVDMLHGQLLFKDTFSIYGPLTSVIQSFAMRLFGEQLFVLKMLTAITYGLIGGVLFIITSYLLPFGVTALIILLWIGSAPYYEPGITFFIWPSVYALFFQLSTVLLIMYWLRNKNVLLLVVAGICAALTFWFRQPVGILLYGAIVFFFFLYRKTYPWRSTLPFHFSFICIHLSALGLLWFYGVLQDWYFQSITFVSWWHWAVVGERRLPILLLEKLFPLSYSPLSIWLLLPASACYVLWKKTKYTPALIMLALVAIGSWAQYYPMNDIHHVYWAATLFFPVLGAVFYHAFRRQRKRLLMLGILCILFIPDLYNRARMIKHKLVKTYIRIEQPAILRNMLVQKSQYDEIQIINRQIHIFEQTNPHGLVITDGGRVLFTTFAHNTKNCSPFTSNWNWEVYNQQFNAEYHQTLTQCRQHNAVLTLK